MPSDNAELIAEARGSVSDCQEASAAAHSFKHDDDAILLSATAATLSCLADALSLTDRHIEELTARCAAMEAVVAAARVRGAYWHNDTCAQVLIENSYACSCGKDALVAALAALDAK